jgi:hypothetical protein
LWSSVARKSYVFGGHAWCLKNASSELTVGWRERAIVGHEVALSAFNYGIALLPPRLGGYAANLAPGLAGCESNRA